MKKLESAPVWHHTKLFDEAKKYSSDQNVEQQVDKINEEYLYWDKVKYYNQVISPELLWARVKISRVINARKLYFGETRFIFNLTNSLQRSLHEFDLHIGGNLGSSKLIPENDKKKYLVSSIMEEAIASSQIEGAVTTRKHAKEMLRKGIKPKNKSEQMIFNNYATIRNIVETKNAELTMDQLLYIHRLIVDQTLEDQADEGKFRTDNDVNVVDVLNGEVVHIPPDFKLLPVRMQELIAFCNDESDDHFIHPIVKACIIHFMIGYLHPFVDGNGRTARALFYWYLLKKGYWLTEFLSISRLIVKTKVQYADAFLYTETDDNDLTYFIKYNLKVMQLAYQELKQYIERKITEGKKLLDFQKIDGVNQRQASIIKWIYDEPDLLFSVKEIENRMSVSNQTARTDLDGLVEFGFLQKTSLNKKVKAYHKAPTFDELVQ